MKSGKEQVVAIALLLSVCSPARADECALSAGMESPCQSGTKLKSAHFVIPREWADKMNAAATVNRQLEVELARCEVELETARDNEGSAPGWGNTIALASAGFAFGFAVGVFVMAR